MEIYGGEVNRLIEELGHLPGIGEKSAQRLAFHIIGMPEDQVKALSEAILLVKQNIKFCSECCTITDQDKCPVCSSANRDHKQIMVVESPKEMAAYERTGVYNGVYHVLHGVINPKAGIGPDDIRLTELISRFHKDVEEVIIATNPSLEGEATAVFISKCVPPGIRCTRIASGVPVGGEVECADSMTLQRALEGRVEL